MQNQEYLLELGKYLTIMVIAVTIGATVVGSIAFLKAQRGSAKTFSLLVRRAGALQMATVVLIILSAVSLKILGQISSEAVTTLLSGIAGYVLGGNSRSGRDEEEKED